MAGEKAQFFLRVASNYLIVCMAGAFGVLKRVLERKSARRAFFFASPRVSCASRSRPNTGLSTPKSACYEGYNLTAWYRLQSERIYTDKRATIAILLRKGKKK